MAKPEIRLKGFEGEWKKKPFSEMVYRVATSGDTKIMPGVEFEDIISGEGVLNKDIKKKKINKVGTCFEPGDVLFGKLRPYLKNILLADFRGVAIGDFWVLRPNNVNSNLLYMLVSSNNFMKVANISSGSKMPRADWNLVSNSDFYFPKEMDEQKSIADYFKSLDSMIQGVTKKIASLKQMKQACLVSLFPQAGETTPRVRFKGFKGDWVKVAMGDVFVERHEISTITNELPQLSFTIEEGVIKPEDRKTNKRDFLIKDKTNKKYLVTYVDDIIYNPANVIYGAIHKNSLCNGVVSPIYKIFYTDQDASFMECVVRKTEFIQGMTVYMEGTVQKLKTLKPEAFLQMVANIAPTKDEQKHIGRFFHSLDSQISLQEQRLEKLKQIKSACLDKMFV